MNLDGTFELSKVIESKRSEMHQEAERHGLLSPEVLKVSQELDLLLNDYNQLKLSSKTAAN